MRYAWLIDLSARHPYPIVHPLGPERMDVAEWEDDDSDDESGQGLFLLTSFRILRLAFRKSTTQTFQA
jgi:hypothetical protein